MYSQDLRDARVQSYSRITAIKLFNMQLGLVFEYMYLIGCRSGELWLLDQATRDNTGLWTVKTLKNNFDRQLTLGTQSEFLDNNIEDLRFYAQQNRKNEIWRMSNRYMSGLINFELDKDVNSYFFRYAYVNELMYDGLQPADIKANLGHRNIQSTMDYITTIDNL